MFQIHCDLIGITYSQGCLSDYLSSQPMQNTLHQPRLSLMWLKKLPALHVQWISYLTIHREGIHTPNQNVPASPRHPNSIRVDIGFLSLIKVNANLYHNTPHQYKVFCSDLSTYKVSIMTRLALHTKMENGTKRASDAWIWSR